MTLRYSKAAEEDLLNILIEGILKYGEAAAERYSVKLQASFDFIEHNPEAVRERHELSPPVRVHRSGVHMIIYMIDEGDPYIIRVRYSGEDWQEDPSGRASSQLK